MIYLLDTHVLLWWVLNEPVREYEFKARIEESVRKGNPVGIAAITLWEIATLVEHGRIRLAGSVELLIEQIEQHPSVHIVPLTGKIALESARLGKNFPKDPADRLIAATARCHGLRLVTADERIRSSGSVALA